jgi:hypothetical protein
MFEKANRGSEPTSSRPCQSHADETSATAAVQTVKRA